MELNNRIHLLSFWMRLAVVNLAIVALLGLLMRYNIALYIPGMVQKNFLHAHSHFAFVSWVSQSLIVFILYVFQASLGSAQWRRMHLLLWLQYLNGFAMLFAFAYQGYKAFSIVFSTASILLFMWFSVEVCWHLFKNKYLFKYKYLVMALMAGIVSTLGTFFLVEMMLTKTVTLSNYLSSVYWYLHFQYNGWFFMALMGVWMWVVKQQYQFIFPKLIFWFFSVSILPAYGLSILWKNPNTWQYFTIVLAAVLQFIAWIWVLKIYFQNVRNEKKIWSKLDFLLVCALFAGFLKFSLQLGSVIPFLSELAFGFRTIVIAYLHLVLLGFVSIFILYLGFKTRLLNQSKLALHSAIFFLVSVWFNELILGIHGVGSLGSNPLPHADIWLLVAAVFLFVSSSLLAFSQLGNFAKPAETIE